MIGLRLMEETTLLKQKPTNSQHAQCPR
jgi:hypothetical protein